MIAITEQTQTERQQLDDAFRMIGRARRDPKAFFELVLKEETTRAAIKCMAHQRVLFDFVDTYDRCCIRMPVGSTKTYCMAGLTMFLIGNDPTERGAIISATQDQAKKPLGMVRDYIETSPELTVVFPDLKPSSRDGDPWTQTAITVERPAGIRDPSLVAVGVDGKLPGARLSWMLIDDILNDQNTATPEQRHHVHRWFTNTVMSRRDVEGAKMVVTNTPWHPEDLTYRLEKAGWPTLTMDIEGGIYITNADEFDTDDIRPSNKLDEEKSSGQPDEHRLTVHDTYTHLIKAYSERDIADVPMHDDGTPVDGMGIPRVDVDDLVPLWPEKFGRTHIAEIRETYAGSMSEYNQLYMCTTRDDESSDVRIEWIDECKDQAQKLGYFNLTANWDEDYPTFTGVDLAIGRKKKHDWSALFTFAVMPTGKRRILDAEFGKWGAKTIVSKIIEKHEQYNSIIAVESNAAQDYLRQWAIDEAATLPIRKFITGRNKVDPHHGLKSMFVEIENGSWLIPSDPMGRVHKGVQMWIDGMLHYDPDGHTNDMLMASWIAREVARKSGFLRKGAVGRYVDRKKAGGIARVMNR